MNRRTTEEQQGRLGGLCNNHLFPYGFELPPKPPILCYLLGRLLRPSEDHLSPQGKDSSPSKRSSCPHPQLLSQLCVLCLQPALTPGSLPLRGEPLLLSRQANHS